MRRRRITQEQVQEREHILNEITAQPPLSQLLRSFQTTEGFHTLFCRIQHLYPNDIEAYKTLEVEYERIFGQRRFSEYDSLPVRNFPLKSAVPVYLYNVDQTTAA